jgi:excisionase family DNA binding protein
VAPSNDDSKNSPDLDPFIKTVDVMALLSLSRTKVWDLVTNHGLPAYKLGGDYRYRRSEVLEWMKQFRVNPPGGTSASKP